MMAAVQALHRVADSKTWGVDPQAVWALRAVAFAGIAIVVVIAARRQFMAPLEPDVRAEIVEDEIALVR